jgi:hypothetical protein
MKSLIARLAEALNLGAPLTAGASSRHTSKKCRVWVPNQLVFAIAALLTSWSRYDAEISHYQGSSQKREIWGSASI